MITPNQRSPADIGVQVSVPSISNGWNSLGNSLLDLRGDLDDDVLLERAARDVDLLRGRRCAREQLEVKPVRADRADRMMLLVAGEDDGAAHPTETARRLGHARVERLGGAIGVDLGEQPREEVERLDGRGGRMDDL